MSVVVGTTSAQTPLGSNFGGMKAQVAAYVQGQNLASVLGDAGIAINAAINKINTRNWNWLNKESSITLAAGTRTYTVPADMKRPRTLEQWNSSSQTIGRFSYQTPKEFDDSVWEDKANGSPEFYTIRNATDDRLLTFNVPPSSSFVSTVPTARMTYYARLQYLANDGDTLGTIEAPPETRNFLVWYARWELASMRGTPTQIRTAREAWADEWWALVRDDTNEQTDWTARSRYR